MSSATGATTGIRWSSVLAVGLWGATVVIGFGAAVPLSMAVHDSWGSTVSHVAIVLAFASVGVVVAARQPRNLIGWALVGAGFFFTLSGAGTGYSLVDYRQHHGSLPLGALAILVVPGWAPAIILIAIGILVFPDGRLLAGRARWVVRGLVGVGAVWLAGAYGIAVDAILAHRVRLDSQGTLLQVDHPRGSWAWWGVAQDAFFAILVASFAFWVTVQLMQYRTLRGERRVQQQWLISGAVACVMSGFFTLLLSSGASPLAHAANDVATAGLAALPICIGIGILKFKLYEIDRVISRTLSYLLLTGLVVGVYAAIISLATRLLSFSSPVAVAASTLAAAALFNPLRHRLQRLVDRRFNRARYDAEATVAAFTARLREVVDADSVRGDLLQVVETTFEPAGVSFCAVGMGGTAEG